MSFSNKLLAAAAAAVVAGCAVPAVASAEPTVDAAKAAFDELGLTTIAQFPSGRTAPPTAGSAENWGYRTYEQVNQELANLASANPGFVKLKTAPYKSVQGRDVKYLEITNDVDAHDGRPVFFMMGTIHGNEWAAMEHTVEFIYDVINTSKTNPKVKAIFDKVRFIAMPIVNPDGVVAWTRANSRGVDMNRNYPFGWGSNIGVSLTARGAGPGSEPEVQNTMEIVKNHQVVALVTNHNASHALFYPGLEIAAGLPADLDVIRGLSLAMADRTKGGYTNVRDSAHDYETSGETVDWSYYATRGFAVTMESVGGSQSCGVRNAPTNRSSQTPNYAFCTVGDYTGVVPDAAPQDVKTAYHGHPVRDAFYQALVFPTIDAGHSVITGKAPAGHTLKVSKSFNLYTNRIKLTSNPEPTNPPQAIPTTLQSSMTVPASGQFSFHVNPSVRPVPPYRAEGMVPGPNGFYQESWTLTCVAPDGKTVSGQQVLIDKGQTKTVAPCGTEGTVGGTVPATLALSLSAPASFEPFVPGVAKEYTATTHATVTSTAGDATLTVADTGANPGHLANGAFTLASPLQGLGVVKSWTGPTSNEDVTVTFKQAIGGNEPLRTGTYAKALTFTLSTTNP
ncbi:hypothetical protein DVA67_024625 [Solirubrobacter sp. CPCC 204708]|uniref:M14 family zinc carboxypeptidase n=1 Tax=Solirubrobacter deserti TaxID=2282478 RepID=A0ABT4RVC9_9ACTN|nr:M14 family zinc carboxypeptidase [Solirubrobacter deserti]MBE2319184.1 hypothetical protein [Solirubrobacter deserti]MDA0142210.1 M14 family zinc carboxypeptidase [Solirubrobacter deserti]